MRVVISVVGVAEDDDLVNDWNWVLWLFIFYRTDSIDMQSNEVLYLFNKNKHTHAAGLYNR